jgi:hypothetical protein
MRVRLLGASLALTLSFGLMAGCSQSSPGRERDREEAARTGASTQAIQGGTNDGAAHPYVVGVCIGNRPNCGICTGTLILPNLVVTARHCVQQTNEQINCATDTFGAAEPVNFVTTYDEIFQTTKNWHAVKTINVPQPDGVCGNDIALITLQDPIPATEATPIIPGVQYAMGDIDRYLHSFTAIGYGKISPADPPGSAQCFGAGADYTKCPGKRRIRQNISVVCIPGDEYIPCPTDADTLAALKDSEFLAGDGTCQGDSGSGAFETKSFGKGLPVTFGVLSRGGTSKDGTTCVSPIYTRLDKWREFVVQAATAASNNWTLYPKPVPDWTVYVPPPADAGPPDSGPKKPTTSPNGTECADDSECASKLCADIGGGNKACTDACDETVTPTTCAEGYVCKAAVCVVDTPAAPAAASSSTTTSGCSVGPARASGIGWATAGLMAAAALLLGARRRRNNPEIT